MKQSHTVLECGDNWPLPGCQGPLTGLVMEVDTPIPISLHDSLETPSTLKKGQRKKIFSPNHLLSDPKSETTPYSVTATIYWMLTKCQGKVPSTLYNTVVQRRSYYPHREWFGEDKYFAQGLKLLSNRVWIQIHVWCLDAMLHTSLSHSMADHVSLCFY